MINLSIHWNEICLMIVILFRLYKRQHRTNGKIMLLQYYFFLRGGGEGGGRVKKYSKESIFTAILESQSPSSTLFLSFFPFFFLCALFNSTLLHLPPLRFHCVRGYWDGSQDCCDFGLIARRSNHSARSHPPFICLCTGDPHYVPYTLLLIS